MKKITLQNSGRTMAMCCCSESCRTRHVVGEMCLMEGEGYKIIPLSYNNEQPCLSGNDIAQILHISEEIIFSTEDEKTSIPPAVLIAIYFDETLSSNKYAGQLIFASNKNGGENFSNDQNFDFWVVPVKDSIKSAKRLDAVPSILGKHKALVEVGSTKIYF